MKTAKMSDYITKQITILSLFCVLATYSKAQSSEDLDIYLHEPVVPLYAQDSTSADVSFSIKSGSMANIDHFIVEQLSGDEVLEQYHFSVEKQGDDYYIFGTKILDHIIQIPMVIYKDSHDPSRWYAVRIRAISRNNLTSSPLIFQLQ